MVRRSVVLDEPYVWLQCPLTRAASRCSSHTTGAGASLSQAVNANGH